MTAIFALSALMLHPKTRVLFKAPVPHLHSVIGKMMIPWGLTYVVYLPYIYLNINGIPWRDHAYIVITMLTVVICMSTISWAYVACLQQGVRQRIMQPVLLLMPVVLMVWYAVSSDQMVRTAFRVVCISEMVLLIGYYVVLYRGFVRDIKENYSSVSKRMFHALWAQWIASAILLASFLMSSFYPSPLWDMVNFVTNLFTLGIFVYTSEHLMPLPEKVEETVEEEEYEDIDIAKALRDKCEAALLFCNPELSLHDLALALGTNRTYLSRWFTINDTTFYHYINGLRVEHAGYLLRNTSQPISQVLTDAGFASKTTFRKYFLSHYGCSPTEYRKDK